MSRTSLRETQLSKTQHNVLRLNVGFLLKQNVGYSRDLDFAEDQTEVADDLELSDLYGSVRLTRTPPGVYVHGEFTARRSGECARCLTEIPLLSTARLSELYIFPPSDEAEFVVTESAELDLAPLLRELILLNEPTRLLCRPDCAGLCPTCGVNRNQGACQCAEENIDPRLAVLQSLLDQV